MVQPGEVSLLLIEDDQTFATIVSRRLSRHGYYCHHAATASDALLLARQIRPQAIVLDMKLDGSNGLALIRPLRHLLPDSRIILLTGYASIATAVEAIRTGADNYLSKPVDTRTLLAALQEQISSLDAADSILGSGEEAPLHPKRLEWEHLQQVLQANQGNISATARQLGMHRRTLQRKLMKKPVSI